MRFEATGARRRERGGEAIDASGCPIPIAGAEVPNSG